jgi:protein transport protein SEC13
VEVSSAVSLLRKVALWRRTSAERGCLDRTHSDQTKEWAPDPVEHALSGHSDWVRDVAWAPSVGVGKAYLASAGQDKTVYIWTQSDARSAWSKVALEPAPQQQQQGQQQQADGKFPDAVWRVSWSVAGNVLAVSSGACCRCSRTPYR